MINQERVLLLLTNNFINSNIENIEGIGEPEQNKILKEEYLVENQRLGLILQFYTPKKENGSEREFALMRGKTDEEKKEEEKLHYSTGPYEILAVIKFKLSDTPRLTTDDVGEWEEIVDRYGRQFNAVNKIPVKKSVGPKEPGVPEVPDYEMLLDFVFLDLLDRSEKENKEIISSVS